MSEPKQFAVTIDPDEVLAAGEICMIDIAEGEPEQQNTQPASERRTLHADGYFVFDGEIGVSLILVATFTRTEDAAEYVDWVNNRNARHREVMGAIGRVKGKLESQPGQPESYMSVALRAEAQYPADALRAAYDHGYRDAQARVETLEAQLLEASKLIEAPIGYGAGILCVAEGVRVILRRLNEQTARANIWEKNYTQSETKTMKALRLRAEKAEARIAELETQLAEAIERCEKAETELEIELAAKESTIADLKDLAYERAPRIAAEEAGKVREELEAQLREANAKLERTWSHREIARLKGELEIAWGQAEAGDRLREKAEARESRLRAALKFYADKSLWVQYERDGAFTMSLFVGNEEGLDDGVLRDGWLIADAALAPACRCGHTWDQHKKPETKISWDACSFPCGQCECSEFDAPEKEPTQ